jgi:hypothetical protein
MLLKVKQKGKPDSDLPGESTFFQWPAKRIAYVLEKRRKGNIIS